MARAVDDLRVDAGPDRVENIAPGEIDCRGAVKGERDVGAVGRDQGAHCSGYVSAGENMGLELSDGDGNTRLVGHHQDIDDQPRVELSQEHPDKFNHPYGAAGGPGLQPEGAELDEEEKKEDEDQQPEKTGDH